MRVEAEFVSQITGVIMTAKGKILVGEGDETLRAAVGMALATQGIRYIILDITEVPYVDSVGLGELVHVYVEAAKHDANKRGVKLVLCGVQQRIRDLLAINKLLTVFEVYDTQKEAREEMSRRF